MAKIIAIDPGMSKCGLIVADLEQQKVLKAILKQEQTAPTSTWHVDGKREFKHVDIILMKLNGGK